MQTPLVVQHLLHKCIFLYSFLFQTSRHFISNWTKSKKTNITKQTSSAQDGILHIFYTLVYFTHSKTFKNKEIQRIDLFNTVCFKLLDSTDQNFTLYAFWPSFHTLNQTQRRTQPWLIYSLIYCCVPRKVRFVIDAWGNVNSLQLFWEHRVERGSSRKEMMELN